MSLYRGHFLGQEGQQSWALAARERFRDKFLRYVQSAAQAYEQVQAWKTAASIYQRGIELDNLAEALYRGLMICHREMGDHVEALRVYRRCRELLSVVLGVQPTVETQAIYQSLKQS
jgi:LuxR family transcriptional regulator, maltose regulon positive regulatory protein